MINKMAARGLTYELGLLSYGDSKLKKWKNCTTKQSSSLKQVFSDVAKNGAIFSSN